MNSIEQALLNAKDAAMKLHIASDVRDGEVAKGLVGRLAPWSRASRTRQLSWPNRLR
jgi:hypothetical protein